LIGYNLVLQVTDDSTPASCSYPSPTQEVFRCDVAPGDIFIGSFAVDELLLEREGDNLAAAIYNFFLPFAGLVFDQHLIYPASAFAAFIGPQMDGGAPLNNAPAPGFNVHSGTVTGLYGGVIAAADSAFVGFALLSPEGTFSATDFIGHNISGTMIVGRNGQNVPEPATLALIAVGVAGAAFARRGARRTLAHRRVRAPD
jgi:hypothetical protein